MGYVDRSLVDYSVQVGMFGDQDRDRLRKEMGTNRSSRRNSYDGVMEISQFLPITNSLRRFISDGKGHNALEKITRKARLGTRRKKRTRRICKNQLTVGEVLFVSYRGIFAEVFRLFTEI